MSVAFKYNIRIHHPTQNTSHLRLVIVRRPQQIDELILISRSLVLPHFMRKDDGRCEGIVESTVQRGSMSMPAAVKDGVLGLCCGAVRNGLSECVQIGTETGLAFTEGLAPFLKGSRTIDAIVGDGKCRWRGHRAGASRTGRWDGGGHYPASGHGCMRHGVLSIASQMMRLCGSE